MICDEYPTIRVIVNVQYATSHVSQPSTSSTVRTKSWIHSKSISKPIHFSLFLTTTNS